MTGRVGVLLAYLAARRRRFPDRAALDSWQAARLTRVLARARTRYPFYADVPPGDLDAFPVMTKALMVEHFAALNDRGLELDRCLALARAAEERRDFTASADGVSIGLSSGTSGRQSVFLTSPKERSRWAGEILARVLPHGLRAGARVALVLRAGGPLYESVGTGRIAFRFFDLARPAREHVPGMAAFAPTVLAAPPHVLRVLAEACAAGDLSLRPERVFSVAEVLDPHDGESIEAGLGVRVDQIYQATEGFLGISCGEGRLHLNEDLLHVELVPLDASGRRCTPVVTDLFRTTQAVVRLRLDDALVTGPDGCPCGSPFRVIDRVEGRADDVLLLPRAATGSLEPFYADFVRGSVLGAGVADFRVEQTSPGLVRLAVQPASAHAAAADALRLAVDAAGLVPPAVEVAPWTDRAPLEKLRRVRRTFAPGGAPGGPEPGVTGPDVTQDLGDGSLDAPV